LIVGFDFGRNGGAIRVSILRLHNRDRLRRPPRATGDQPPQLLSPSQSYAWEVPKGCLLSDTLCGN
jgi:hypothetical protein